MTAPARDICHGKRGQIMQVYRTGQEDQLGALGLVLNAAVEQLRPLPADQREHEVLGEDVACSPCYEKAHDDSVYPLGWVT
ncbi:hypothetical protein ACFYQA_38865 [Streptomyces sp. NPDC005774]|uniref:hypothetical protein n=1 Tax=Streptomyces sp. NPDC005774 TaxID=3364728 RepID=UPI00367A8628